MLRWGRVVLACFLAFAAGMTSALLVFHGRHEIADWKEAIVSRIQGREGIAVRSTIVHANADGWAEVVVQNRGGKKARVAVVADGEEPFRVEGEEVILNPWQWKTIRFRIPGEWKEARVLVKLRAVDDEDQKGAGSHINAVFSVPVRVIRG